MPGEMFCQNCGVQLPPVASSPPPPPVLASNFGNRNAPAPILERRSLAASVCSPDSPGDSGLAGAITASSPRLVLSGDGVEIRLPMDQPVLVIGRTDAVQDIYPDVDLVELGGEKCGVSRRHARLYQKPDGVYLEDLNSANFTCLNRIRLQPGQIYLLRNGDEIRLGALTLEYHS